MVKSRTLSELFDGPSFQAHFLRNAAVRLARLQFRPGTFYSFAKPYVPLFAILAAWLVASHSTFGWADLPRETISVWHLAVAVALVIVWNLFCLGASQRQWSHTPYLKETFPACLAGFACGGALSIVHWVWPTGHSVVSGGMLAAWMEVSYAFLLFMTWLFSEHLIPLITVPKIALIVGTGSRGRALKRDLAFGNRYQVIGMIDDEYRGTDPVADGYLGPISDLRSLLKERPVEQVLIALPIGSMYDTIQKIIRTCEIVGVDSSYMSDLFETRLARRHDERRAEHAHLTVLTAHRPEFRRWIKTLFDFCFAAILLILLAPLLIVIALAVKLTSPGPVFFSQLRYGQHRKRFPMYKFRTMVVDAEARQAELEKLNEAEGPVFKIKKDPRITSIGGLLRKMSLDELPQLINVLRGEMSLVGPRPLPLRDVGKFEESWLLRRFSVKPGLTCLWQVNGRSNTSFTEWIRLDLEYIDRWSLSLDFKILIMTLPAVLKGRGAS
jgi:exopolysaccharide biosynthesis polyprenyl glycosylphosphotransferase